MGVKYEGTNLQLLQQTVVVQICSFGSQKEDARRCHCRQRKNVFCDDCDYSTVSREALRKHRKSKHAEMYEQNKKSFVATIKCPMCEFSCCTTEALIDHNIQIHNSDMKVEERIFDSNEEFETWLEDTRKSHCIDFVTRSGAHGARHMVCSRSGTGKAHWSVDAVRVARYPVRCGEHCTAFLRTKALLDGTVEAKFCLSHTGHEKEPGRLRMSQSEKQHISNLAELDHDENWILNKIQELYMDKDSERLYFTSRKEVRAVLDQFGLNRGQRDTNDMVSVKKWIDEDTENGCTDFFGYQPATNSDGDGFRLGIVTDEQVELLKQYAYRGVCMDSTHNCTKYKYKLVTLLVFDDVGRGRPCGFYFCQEESAEQLLPFFQEVRNRCGPLAPEMMMSDDNSAFWNAWQQVFDVSRTLKILCSWHVMHNWTQNRGKIVDKAKQQKILEDLYLLHREPRRNEFDLMLVEMLTKLEDEPEFKQYILDHYLRTEERIKQWAPYSHAGLVAHTNMAIERWHRTLKKTYLQGSQNKRLDYVVFCIFKAIDDMNRECEVQAARKGLSNQYRIRETHKRHKDAWKHYAPNPSMIKPGLDHNSWLVKSRTVPDLWYTISKRRPCKCPIEARCRLCKVCWEEYTCHCPDSIRSGVACGHVHAVVSLKQTEQSTTPQFEQSQLTDSLHIDHVPQHDDLPVPLLHSQPAAIDIDPQHDWKIKCARKIMALKPSTVPRERQDDYLALLEQLERLQIKQPFEVQPRNKYTGRPPNARPQRSGGDSQDSPLVVAKRTTIRKR